MRTTLVLLCSSLVATVSRAEPLIPTVVPVDGCPSQAAVDAELQRLLPMPPPEAFAVDLLVGDHGDSFEVTICGAQRFFVDQARDCGERARVAAVTIAVTVAPPVVVFAGASAPPLPPVVTPPPSPVVTPPPTPPLVVTPPPSSVATAPTLVRAAPARSTRFLLGLDASAGYRSLGIGMASYGVGEFHLQLGAEFPRWAVAFDARLTYGKGLSETYLFEAVFGPAFIVKLGQRTRLGFTTAMGYGGANDGSRTVVPFSSCYWDGSACPTETIFSGPVFATSTHLMFDLVHGEHSSLYAVAGIGFNAWIDRECLGCLGARIPPYLELAGSLGLGYRFNH
jgi:hypothetical protein